MLQIKFDYNRRAGLGDIHVWKCGRTGGRTDGRTDARMPARVSSYKLTMWAFGSGELKSHCLSLLSNQRLHAKFIYTSSFLSKLIQNVIFWNEMNQVSAYVLIKRWTKWKVRKKCLILFAYMHAYTEKANSSEAPVCRWQMYSCWA